MRIDVPVYIKTGPKLHYEDGVACLKNPQGVVTWRYSGKEHTGIGIAACARSGTVYTTKVLKSLGYDIGHEQWAKDGSVGYHLVAIKPDNCFHQVRNPLDQISSMLAHQSWGFMNDLIDMRGHGLFGCMQYWYKWNELCDAFCVWRYQIEDLPNIWDEFLERIGHTPCPLPDVPTNTNTHKKYKDFQKLTWADLFNCDRQLAQQIKEKAEFYGYNAPEMDKAEYQNLRELETAEVA